MVILIFILIKGINKNNHNGMKYDSFIDENYNVMIATSEELTPDS